MIDNNATSEKAVRTIEQTHPLESGGIPDSWFRAYLEGNRLMPQSNIAIDILVLDSVLKDPPGSWTDFSRIKLSAVQLAELGQAMNIAHQAYDVSYATEGTGGGKPVRQERLQDLWSSVTKRITHGLKYYMVENIYGRIGYDVFVNAGQESTARLNAYFSSPEGSLKLVSLGEAVSVAKEALRSPKAKDEIDSNRRLTLRMHRTESRSEQRNAFSDRANAREKLKSVIRSTLSTNSTNNYANQALIQMLL